MDVEDGQARQLDLKALGGVENEDLLMAFELEFLEKGSHGDSWYSIRGNNLQMFCGFFSVDFQGFAQAGKTVSMRVARRDWRRSVPGSGSVLDWGWSVAAGWGAPVSVVFTARMPAQRRAGSMSISEEKPPWSPS